MARAFHVAGVLLAVRVTSAFIPLGKGIPTQRPERGLICAAKYRSAQLVLVCCSESGGQASDEAEARLKKLPRIDLQALAKTNGVRANAKSEWIVAELLRAGVGQPGDPAEGLEQAIRTSATKDAEDGESSDAKEARVAEIDARSIADRLDGVGSVVVDDTVELLCMAASFAPRFVSVPCSCAYQQRLQPRVASIQGDRRCVI
jgi:hypothetical protein